MKPYEIALQEYATHDIAGPADNPRVIQYFKEIGQSWVQDDDTAWCAAFVNWCLLKAKRPHTGKLNARSFLTYGIQTQQPELGDLVVLWRITREGPYGHIGFFVRETGGLIYLLGGNQDDAVNIKPFPKYRVLQYRKIPLTSG